MTLKIEKEKVLTRWFNILLISDFLLFFNSHSFRLFLEGGSLSHKLIDGKTSLIWRPEFGDSSLAKSILGKSLDKRIEEIVWFLHVFWSCKKSSFVEAIFLFSSQLHWSKNLHLHAIKHNKLLISFEIWIFNFLFCSGRTFIRFLKAVNCSILLLNWYIIEALVIIGILG